MKSTNSKLSAISENFKRGIVFCVNAALQDDCKKYVDFFELDREDIDNAIKFQMGDWVQKNIRKHLIDDADVEMVNFRRRGGWKGRVLIDRVNRITYTVMREKRLKQIMNEIRAGKKVAPHYLQSMIYTLNAHLVSREKQLKLVPCENFPFDKEQIERDYNDILQGRVREEEGYIHCIVLYEGNSSRVIDVAMVVLDKDFDEVERLSLNEFIGPDFDKLTEAETRIGYDYAGVEEEDSSTLISLIRHEETTETPVELLKSKKKSDF